MAKSGLWMHGLASPATDHIKILADNGFEYVVADGSQQTVAACADNGLSLYLCSGAFGKGSHPDEFLSLDVNGDRQIWFGSTCPNQPLVRENNLEGIARMAETEGISGVYIDGCRFASPSSGLEPFFTCFCPLCEAKANEMSFDFAAMKRDVSDLYRMIRGSGTEFSPAKLGRTPSILLTYLIDHPGILDWFRFREACTTDHLRKVRHAIKGVNPDLVFAIYIFTPTLAPLVGQNYSALSKGVVDLFSPMIYRNFPPPDGPACLNREIFDMAGWFSEKEDTVMEMLCGLFGVPLSPRQRLEDYGLPPETVGDETSRARAQIGQKTPLVPILYLDDPHIESSIEAAVNGGADGVSFFVYQEDRQSLAIRAGESWQQLRGLS